MSEVEIQDLIAFPPEMLKDGRRLCTSDHPSRQDVREVVALAAGAALQINPRPFELKEAADALEMVGEDPEARPVVLFTEAALEITGD